LKKAILTRNETGDSGTFGVLVTDSSFTCHTGELPWKGNQEDISCVPEGIYVVTYRYSIKNGMCYHLENVPGRTVIEIHAANFCGDISKGLKSDLLGCIAPGLDVGMLSGQKAILNSRQALDKLESALNYETFELTIKEDYSLVLK
jgi:hypothetical protein